MAASGPHITIAAEPIFEQAPLITNSIVMSWVSMAILIVLGLLFCLSY